VTASALTGETARTHLSMGREAIARYAAVPVPRGHARLAGRDVDLVVRINYRAGRVVVHIGTAPANLEAAA